MKKKIVNFYSPSMEFNLGHSVLGSDVPISKVASDGFEDLVWTGNETVRD
jgi:hypothetical protein